MKERQSNGSGRQDFIEQYDYDTKFFMHSVRLLTSAIEILETGDFQTYRPNRQLLLDCRNGKYSFDKALEMIKDLDSQLKRALETSELPEQPDYEKINQVLIEINRLGLEF
ncbi:hypothetical protein GCM10008967_31940 [Bacillus carboniphilus]|uniref:Nucleotidyltransferase n=1 Tax=Bacillus carboniphilus TaxID=86663 RepID=A0ABP3G9B2_9BACI